MTTEFCRLMRLLQGRRSIRRYHPRPVPEEMIEQILQAAAWAPSAANRQAYRFLVVTRAETLKAMEEAVQARTREIRARLQNDARESAEFCLSNFTHFAKAPLVLVPIHRAGPDLIQAACDRQLSSGQPEASQESLCSVSAAIMNLLLAAHALGLGACWMTGPLLAKESLERTLRVPAGWAMTAVIPVGFPAEQPDPPARRAVDRLRIPVD